MSVTDHVQNRTGETMWSREHFFTSLFLSAATSHSLQPCTDVLKGFYLVWNRRAEKRTDFSGKTARRLLTLLYIRPFVCSVYISIPPYPPPTPPQPSLPPGANTQYQIQMPLAASCKSSWVNQSHRCRDGESWQVKDLGASW